MRSLVLFGVFCVAAVKAGNIIPVYGTQYTRPGLRYPYETLASYPYGKYLYGGLPLAGAPYYGVAPGAPNVVAPVAPVAPTDPSPVAPAGPLAPGAPGGSVIFTGTGEVTAAGTGLGFFAGRGEVDFAGDFPAGVFMGEGQARFDGEGQIQVSTVPGFGVVGGFQNFVGQGGFQGVGAAAAVGTGVVNAQGTGIAGLVGNGVVNVNGVGQTNINPLRDARGAGVSTYTPALPSYGNPAQYYNGYSAYGSLYKGGYMPRAYGTYRLIRPAPVAGVSGTTYAPAYAPAHSAYGLY